MSELARDLLQKIIDEHAKQQNEHEIRRKELDKLVVHFDGRMKNVELATIMEQIKTDEKVSKLLEDHKNEKDQKVAALKRILILEKQLDEKKMVELENQQLKSQLQIMSDQLKEKNEEMDDLESLNQTLVVKQLRFNDELQGARNVLIHGLGQMPSSSSGRRPSLGIKRMGDLNSRVFVSACEQRFGKGGGKYKASQLCSQWEEELKNPDWHPFEIATLDGKTQYDVILIFSFYFRKFIISVLV
ncbi:hypothetical protein Cni_G23782 [Canna indica]|uniref:Factor of DNA methylation 1-5/IDN2 domain-containing protein n=1 Tax=Canna indica TaxID=4628 RepID=A0AAQ3QMU3_9LILI|nr:hypothetical protein Cni_G23782 [Canna indica]